MRNRREIRLLLLAVLFAAVSFMASLCVVWADSPEFDDYSDLSGKRVSMLTGAPFEDLVRSKVPDVGEFSYYNSMPDMILALKNDKTDAILRIPTTASPTISSGDLSKNCHISTISRRKNRT